MTKNPSEKRYRVVQTGYALIDFGPTRHGDELSTIRKAYRFKWTARLSAFVHGGRSPAGLIEYRTKVIDMWTEPDL